MLITAYNLRGTPHGHGMNRDLAVTYNINAIIILGDVCIQMCVSGKRYKSVFFINMSLCSDTQPTSFNSL